MFSKPFSKALFTVSLLVLPSIYTIALVKFFIKSVSLYFCNILVKSCSVIVPSSWRKIFSKILLFKLSISSLTSFFEKGTFFKFVLILFSSSIKPTNCLLEILSNFVDNFFSVSFNIALLCPPKISEWSFINFNCPNISPCLLKILGNSLGNFFDISVDAVLPYAPKISEWSFINFNCPNISPCLLKILGNSLGNFFDISVDAVLPYAPKILEFSFINFNCPNISPCLLKISCFLCASSCSNDKRRNVASSRLSSKSLLSKKSPVFWLFILINWAI